MITIGSRRRHRTFRSAQSQEFSHGLEGGNPVGEQWGNRPLDTRLRGNECVRETTWSARCKSVRESVVSL